MGKRTNVKGSIGSIGVGLYDDHNGGIAAVSGGRVLLYCELERITRIKNQGGWFPGLIAQLLLQLPLDLVHTICATNPRDVVQLLQDNFGAEPETESNVSLGGHLIRVIGQDGLHPQLHILAALLLSEVRPGVYATLVFDADQPKIGWVDLRFPLTRLPDFHFRMVSNERWFNGEIFSDLFGKTFYGSQNLSHCGKLMGLSSWGQTRRSYVELLTEFAQRHFDPSTHTWLGYSHLRPQDAVAEMASLIGADPMNHELAQTIDLATSAQSLFSDRLVTQVVEGMVLVRDEIHRSGLPAPQGLIYGGGCALSVVTNKMLREALDLPLIIPPYAHDASQFVGAAVWASIQCNETPFELGQGWTGLPCHTVGHITGQWRKNYIYPTIPAHPTTVAQRILEGQLIAVAQGGAEAGPRALGMRSLLANALDPHIRDHINFNVKKREWYRPFAPALPASTFSDYFARDATSPASLMLDAYDIRSAYRSLLSAVSSPDGICRPQAVIPEQNPWYHDLLLAFGKLTGHPVILNTSLNAPGRPIAYDLAQVIADCAVLGVDAAVLDGYLVERETIHNLASES